MAARRELPAVLSAVDQSRERMRGWVALALVGLLFTVFAGSFVGVITSTVSVRDLKELLPIFLGPLGALVGAATGFYFGGTKR